MDGLIWEDSFAENLGESLLGSDENCGEIPIVSRSDFGWIRNLSKMTITGKKLKIIILTRKTLRIVSILSMMTSQCNLGNKESCDHF